MSDTALLVRAMRPGPPRSLILVHIAAFFATVLVLIALIGPSSTGGWTRAIFLGAIFGWVPGIITVLTLMVFFDERLGPSAYEEELLRRAGWHSFETLVSNAQEEWPSMPGPGWLLLFYGRALPHGGEHFVQVTLWHDSTQPCPVEYGGLRWLSPALSSGDPRERVYLGRAELLPDERDNLGELLESCEQKSDGDDTSPKSGKSPVIDGYPFDLLALRRGPGESLELAGNLADPDGPAAVRKLAGTMLDIAQRAGAQRSEYGTIERGHLVFSER